MDSGTRKGRAPPQGADVLQTQAQPPKRSARTPNGPWSHSRVTPGADRRLQGYSRAQAQRQHQPAGAAALRLPMAPKGLARSAGRTSEAVAS